MKWERGIKEESFHRLAHTIEKKSWNSAHPHWDPDRQLSKEQWKEIDEKRRQMQNKETEETKHGITLEQGDFGTYLIVDNATGKDLLVQIDWDFPGVASTFGWPGHEHPETDGTVKCPVCGAEPSEMIGEAQEWLDDHIGDTAEDPGYFDSGEDFAE